MSNFMCDKCKIINEYSAQGYISGCGCYKPDQPGLYRCMVKIKESTGVVISTYNTFRFINSEWEIEDNKTVLRWKLIQ